MEIHRRYLSALLLGVMLLPVWAMAQDWPEIFPPKPQVRLIAAQTAIGEGEIKAGVHIRLGKAWKTYAQNPQKTGLPPKFNWSGSRNLKSAQVRFPEPKRLAVFDSEIIGYENEVVFPVIIAVEDRRQPLHLRLDLSYAICADLCVPLQEELSLTLAPGPARPSRQEKIIGRFLDKVRR